MAPADPDPTPAHDTTHDRDTAAGAESSGKEFERGTRSDAVEHEEAGAETPGTGKGFARGTDSDSDGHGYEPPSRSG